MRTFKEKVCKHCGNSYIPNGSSSCFCSKPCRVQYYKDKGISRQYRMTFNAKNGCQVGVGSGGLTKSGKDNFGYTTGISIFRNHGRQLKESGVPCNRCGKSLVDAPRGMWCSHHIDQDRTNNDLSNFELLCKRCHQINHDSYDNLMKVQRLSREGVAITNSEAPAIQTKDDDIV